jgi:hypothetical protein
VRLFSGFSKTEKRIMTVALIIALLCLLLFSRDDLFYRFVARRPAGSGGVEIGKISFLDKDVRLKSRQTFEWGQANQEQALHAGDAIYSGKGSSAHIELGKDKMVEVGPDSLVRFREINGENLGDLQLGDFRFKVDGKVKVAINGVPTMIEGSKSEAMITVDKGGRAKVSLVQGQMKVTSLATKGRVAKSVDLTKKVEVDYQELAGTKPEPVPIVPVPIENTSLYSYNLRLYDLYTMNDGRLTPRSDSLGKVKADLKVAWETTGPVRVEVQFSDNPEFRNATSLQTESSTIKPPEVALGANFWRVRSASSQWSRTQSFEVASSLIDVRPILSTESTKAYLIGGVANAKLSWAMENSEFKAKGYIIERSNTPEFPPESTVSVWKTSLGTPLKFANAGKTYFRARAANEKLELTGFSSTLEVEVVDPPLPSAPVLLSRGGEFAPDKNWPIRLEWQKVAGAEAYRIEITHGKETITRVQQGTKFESKNLPVGAYQFRVAAIDNWNREGDYSGEKKFAVNAVTPKPAPEVAPMPMLARKEEPKRAPGSADKEPIAGLAAALKLDDLNYYNESYKDSHFQFEGLNMILVSNLSNGTGAQIPLIAGLAARVLHWFDRHNGAEIGFKSKVAGYNQAAQSSSPMAFEARYKYRFFLPWRWFSFLRELQVSAVTGVEAYRNPNSRLFTTSYDLAKVGFNLEFPLGKRWDTGGESLIGMASDSSQKFELSGHVHYNLTKESSFGFGYRLHVFDAATPKSSPVNALPYKEAYGEGYSVFRMSY